MVTSLHYWVEDSFLAPHLGLPITNTHEIFKMEGVTFKSIDWTVMFALICAEFELGFNSLSLHHTHNVTLLCSNQELLRASVSVVFH